MRSSILLLLALAGSGSQACINDSDTLRQSIAKFPTVIDAIVGRFDRNPRLYYEMRIARLTPKLAADPSDLQDYDDIAVAFDRIGDDDQAIFWMQKKAARLAFLDKRAPTYQRYSYHANLGTFQIHKWVHDGARPDQLSLIKRSEENIAKAIEIDPKAHFNREPVQLAVIQWIRTMVEAKRGTPLILDRVRPLNGKESVEGAAGLVILGAAWESVDLFRSLGNHSTLHIKSGTALHFAQFREQELIRSGKHSLQSKFGGPDAPPRSLASLQKDSGYVTYLAMRKNADEYVANREQFMLAKLQQGKHPDTDPDFWAGYKEVPRYLPPWTIWDILPSSVRFTWPYWLTVGSASSIAIALYVRSFRRRRSLFEA